MNTKTTAPPLVNSLVAFAALSILLLAMQAASEILSPILLALILAICASPMIHWLMKKGLSGGLALGITIVIVVLIIVLLVWMVGASLQNFNDTMTEYQERFTEIEQQLGGALSNLGVDLETLGEDEDTSPMSIVGFAAQFVGGIVSSVSNWFLILMTSVFFMLEVTSIQRKLDNLLHGEDDPDVPKIVSLAAGLRQYMVINAFVGALAAVVNTIFLAIMGVEFAVLWGILSFFFSFVPNVGFIISVIPPAILALIQFGVTEMLIVIGAYVVINFLVDNVIKPRFIEEGVNISATVTFLSLIIWGWVLGPIGAILAVPMSIIVQAILANNEETRWMAYLMGSGKDPYDPDGDADEDPAVAEGVAS
jgi:predicted PurR-regulated permease PerM